MRRKLDVVKLKCRGKWSTGESVNVSNSSAFSALRTSLDLFKEVAGLTGVPGLQAGVKALVILLDTVQVRITHIVNGYHSQKLCYRKLLRMRMTCSHLLSELRAWLLCSQRQLTR